jgi:2Fe-2S ferredoxin
MIALVDNDYDIEMMCGGVGNCATCHVYIGADWVTKLPTPEKDEIDLLEQSSNYRVESRLSCQIKLDESMEGLQVTLAPIE